MLAPNESKHRCRVVDNGDGRRHTTFRDSQSKQKKMVRCFDSSMLNDDEEEEEEKEVILNGARVKYGGVEYFAECWVGTVSTHKIEFRRIGFHCTRRAAGNQ